MKNLSLFHLQRQVSQLQDEVLREWQNILHTNAFTYGKATEQFEQKFAKFCQTSYAVGVRSGTASLIVALAAAGLKPGDEVITTPMTFAASGDAITLIGAKPVFVDVLPETGNIDPSLIEAALTPKTKAVLVVHLYGIPCRMDEIVKITKKNHLSLIEDASHAHGSTYHKQKVGSFGLAGCFSLYPSKILGAFGNAGVITSSDATFIRQVQAVAHHGIVDKKQKYRHHFHGYNELIDNLQSSVLNLKMKYLSQWIRRRTEIAEHYNAVFQEMGHPGMMSESDTTPALYMFAVQMKNRTKFQSHMSKKGIETGVYYPVPLHLQKSYADLKYKKGDFPHAERFAKQTISLPLYPELLDSEVEYILQAIKQYFQ